MDVKFVVGRPCVQERNIVNIPRRQKTTNRFRNLLIFLIIFQSGAFSYRHYAFGDAVKKFIDILLLSSDSVTPNCSAILSPPLKNYRWTHNLQG
jgi:hypothetical protein